MRVHNHELTRRKKAERHIGYCAYHNLAVDINACDHPGLLVFDQRATLPVGPLFGRLLQCLRDHGGLSFLDPIAEFDRDKSAALVVVLDCLLGLELPVFILGQV